MRAQVVVVDDDEENCQALCELLGAEGFGIVPFLGGEAAWSAIRGGHVLPDAVVADVRMPGLDGIGLLARLKAHDAEMPVILVSAFPDPSLWARARGLGASDIFPKPIQGEALAGALRACIALRRTRSTR
jgi:two-component system C4-dicarboxylate transport response regulator DctD